MKHVPVLRKEVQQYMKLKRGDIVVDATLGLGGHARDILEQIGAKGRLYAFEQDQRNLKQARENLRDFKKQIIYFHDNFCYLKTRITVRGAASPQGERSPVNVDAVLFDLGLSSAHVDDPKRGFSFLKNGPLDMRFDSRNKLTAEIVVNTYSEEKLVDIFFRYGEEKFSKKIAWMICQRRKKHPFRDTLELADFIALIVSGKFAKRHHPATKRHHPATQIFQALRIEVNDELSALSQGLKAATQVLKIAGRIVVISYHSLEDRLVKQFFKALLHPQAESQEASLYSLHGEPFFEALIKKPVIPSEEEIKANPRSRSAKLRAYKKIREF